MKVTDVKSNYFQTSLQGFGLIVEDIEDINQCLKIIVLTRPGTDPLRPEFGCGLPDLVDKPANKSGDIIMAVSDAIGKFEKRITVNKIIPTFSEKGSTLKISVRWQFVNIPDSIIEQTDIIYGIR